MDRTHGLIEREKKQIKRWSLPAFFLTVSFFLLELFAYFFLGKESEWPLRFGLYWAILLTGLIRLLPGKAGRIAYCVIYFLFYAYAAAQTGYYILFREMMWLSDFRYASEGVNYLDILLRYPAAWWWSVAALGLQGVLLAWRYPQSPWSWKRMIPALAAVLVPIWLLQPLPQKVFEEDEGIRYAGSDYGRMQSAEAAYENMFNAHRLYQVCGLYQTAVKDVYTHYIFPATPGFKRVQEQERAQIDSYFSEATEPQENEMTGILADKNVILVLMESMDDWMIGEHTPTICRLMDEGINFTRFYTPAYGGIRTFNTEFCINTGSFLSSRGGYAFDYVTNHFQQSLPSLLKDAGYSALTFHYNDPSFYSRGVFSEALGYERYISYQEYETDKDALYDDQLLFDNPQLNALFFREGKKLNFVITRAAHLSYRYNEVLSYWGLKKYPQYRGLTDNEETNCAFLKARLVDDFFARMLAELEANGELENTVIVAVTDHYTYGYKNEEALLELSNVEQSLLLEQTPCFIWSPGLAHREVEKVLNTSDLLPTVLNLLGVKSPYRYIGSDAFDDRYDGFVPFSNGSWIYGNTAFDATKSVSFGVDGTEGSVSAVIQQKLKSRVQEFIAANNRILETDYYKE